MIAYIIISALYSIIALSFWKILNFESVKGLIGEPSDIWKMMLAIFWIIALSLTIIDIATKGDLNGSNVCTYRIQYGIIKA